MASGQGLRPLGERVPPGNDTLTDDALISRIAWRVMPLVVLVYLIAIIDRANVGFAKLQMVTDLHMTEASYGLASSLFFLGYLIVEVPSTLAVSRYGARRWLARIMFTWGLCTVLLGLNTSSRVFYVLRLLLGLAEAGAYPGLIFYISLWFPQSHRVRMMGVLTLGSAFGNMFGSLLGGPLLDLGGTFGLAGWQWVFIATGLPAILLCAALWFGLPDTPAQAKFLTDAERRQLKAAMAREPPTETAHGNPLAMLWNRHVLMLSGLYTLILTSLYGVIYWLPTVVRGFHVTGTQNGLISSVPWAAAAVALFIIPRRIKQQKETLRAACVIAAIGVLCFVAAVLLPELWMRLVALSVGTPCVSLLLPCFWSLPSRRFSGAQAAAAIGSISMLGSLGGFFAQNLMPLVSDATGSAAGAMLVPAVCLAGVGLIAFAMIAADRRVGQERKTV